MMTSTQWLNLDVLKTFLFKNLYTLTRYFFLPERYSGLLNVVNNLEVTRP